LGTFKVEIARILQIDEMHDPRKISPGSLQKEVIMIVHEAIDVYDGTEPFVAFP
jgi:hypothetical protein